MRRRGTFFLIISLIAFGAITGCLSGAQEGVGNTGRELKPCPKSPNCVSTKSADPEKVLNPLPYLGTGQESRNRLIQILHRMKRCKIVSSTPTYIHAEFRSALFRFVDDVEFLFDNRKRQIHFRSASRKGYYDFGVNRRRMKEISGLYHNFTEKSR